MTFAFTMMDFVLEMMNFAFQMMNFVSTQPQSGAPSGAGSARWISAGCILRKWLLAAPPYGSKVLAATMEDVTAGTGVEWRAYRCLRRAF